MAGERCNEAFWDEVVDPSGATGTICKAGGKRRSIPHSRATEQKEINRDRTVVEEDGDVKRFLWDCPIGSFDRDDNELTFKDCGWETKTTKDRLNKLLPGDRRIRQEDFEWYIDGDEWTGRLELDMDDLEKGKLRR